MSDEGIRVDVPVKLLRDALLAELTRAGYRHDPGPIQKAAIEAVAGEGDKIAAVMREAVASVLADPAFIALLRSAIADALIEYAKASARGAASKKRLGPTLFGAETVGE